MVGDYLYENGRDGPKVDLLTEEEFSQRYPERVMATHVLWNPRLKRHMDARTGIMGKAESRNSPLTVSIAAGR